MYHKYNIDNSNNIETKSMDKVYKKCELLKKFENFIILSGFTIIKWINKNTAPYEILIKSKNDNLYRIVLYLKNVTDAGWKDKPWVKRVQVNNVRNSSPESYIYTDEKQTFMILGYYNYDNNPLMMGWKAYNYVMHVTQRSCYVTIDDMLEGYKKGYHTCIVSKQKVWIFTSENFASFLENYINENKIEE